MLHFYVFFFFFFFLFFWLREGKPHVKCSKQIFVTNKVSLILRVHSGGR